MDAGKLTGIIDGTKSKKPIEITLFLFKETVTRVQAAVKKALAPPQTAARYANFHKTDEFVAFEQVLEAGVSSVHVSAAVSAAIEESELENLLPLVSNKNTQGFIMSGDYKVRAGVVPTAVASRQLALALQQRTHQLAQE